ncbi:MAG: hypothetical protein HUU54_04965 [Ignavibacteriaceae bacterium]|nr:hypothetical protein [Ignavibacteriaceae bacterium]
MLLPKKYFIVIFDTFIPHFKANVQGVITDEDTDKFRKVLLKNLIDVLPVNNATGKVLVLTTVSNGLTEELSKEKRINKYVSFNSIVDSNPEIITEGNLILFVSLCTLGLLAEDIENALNVLDRDEENGIYVLDSDSRVALFASNTWDKSIYGINITDHLEYDNFLKSVLLLPFKIDRLITKNPIQSACNAGKLYRLMSDRKNSLFSDPSNHKELNLLFIEHKEILSI